MNAAGAIIRLPHVEEDLDQRLASCRPVGGQLVGHPHGFGDTDASPKSKLEEVHLQPPLQVHVRDQTRLICLPEVGLQRNASPVRRVGGFGVPFVHGHNERRPPVRRHELHSVQAGEHAGYPGAGGIRVTLQEVHRGAERMALLVVQVGGEARGTQARAVVHARLLEDRFPMVGEFL
ncbi:hypothetical protein PBRA_009704, partial [Plasmodiophora brassicae]